MIIMILKTETESNWLSVLLKVQYLRDYDPGLPTGRPGLFPLYYNASPNQMLSNVNKIRQGKDYHGVYDKKLGSILMYFPLTFFYTQEGILFKDKRAHPRKN